MTEVRAKTKTGRRLSGGWNSYQRTFSSFHTLPPRLLRVPYIKFSRNHRMLTITIGLFLFQFLYRQLAKSIFESLADKL